MILLAVCFIDGMAVSSALFATLAAFLLWLAGIEPNMLGLLMLGWLNWCVAYAAFGLRGRLMSILEIN